MEAGFQEADSANLPTIDSLMIARFLTSNPNLQVFRNAKTSGSYGDDAIGYVQLQREANLCTVKCEVCSEHNDQIKHCAVTLTIDEHQDEIVNVQCHGCTTQSICKHALAFVMWAHRRSEEPFNSSIVSYWKKSVLALLGTNPQFELAKNLFKKEPQPKDTIPNRNDVLEKFIQEAKKRNVDCLLLRYQPDYEVQVPEKLSLHQLICKYNNNDCISFLSEISHTFTKANIQKAEEQTRNQNKSNMWHELRYARIMDSMAYTVTKCKADNESLIEDILGLYLPNKKMLKRVHTLEEDVKKVISVILGKEIKKCGLMISQDYPYIAASPSGICDKTLLINIKYPLSEKNEKIYIKDNKITEKYMAETQVQMFVSNLKKCYFCVASWDFDKSHIIHTVSVDYNEDYAKKVIQSLASFWKNNVYPALKKTVE